jgi:DNA-binding transcriptional ArsR family regulator
MVAPASLLPDDADRRLSRALAHPLRVRILRHLIEHGATSPGQLAAAWSMEVASVSYHVRRLADLGFLRLDAHASVRERMTRRYTLSAEASRAAPRLVELFDNVTRRRLDRADVGAALRRFREARGISRFDVACRVSLDHGEVEAIESGHANPPVQTLIDLAEAMGASLFDVLGDRARSTGDLRRGGL